MYSVFLAEDHLVPPPPNRGEPARLVPGFCVLVGQAVLAFQSAGRTSPDVLVKGVSVLSALGRAGSLAAPESLAGGSRLEVCFTPERTSAAPGVGSQFTRDSAVLHVLLARPGSVLPGVDHSIGAGVARAPSRAANLEHRIA